MERVLDKEIMAIVPKYVDNKGNCTKIYTMGMEPLVLEKNVKTIMRLISKHYMIDLKELKNRYRAVVSSPNLVPIPFSKRDIFIPFKTRRPMYKGDGAFAYINMRYIEKIKDEKNGTVVYLSNGESITCLCSLTTIDKHMKNGYVVSRCYEDRAMKVAEDEMVYNARLVINGPAP